MNRRTVLAWLPLACTCVAGLIVVVFDLQAFMQRLASLSALDTWCYAICIAVGGCLYKHFILPPTFDGGPTNLATLKPAACLRLLKRQLSFQWRCLKQDLPASHKRHRLIAVIGEANSGRHTCLKATESLQPIIMPKTTNPLPFDIHFWHGDGQIVCVLSPTLHPDLAPNQRKVLLQHLQRFLTRRWWHQHPWQRFFIVTSISALKTTTQAEQETTLGAINQCLAAFQHTKKNPTIDVIFSHMDHVAGFSPFFEHLDDRARQDTWSFSMRDLTTFSLPQFNKPFKAWIDQLNQCLIKRLHHESQHHRLCLIKDFPIQLEKLREPMFWWLSQLAIYPHYVRNGILFVSATQDGRYIDFLRPCLLKERTPVQPCQTGNFCLDQNYFCHRILQMPTSSKPLFSGPSASILPQSMMATVLTLCFMALMLFGRHAHWLFGIVHAQHATSNMPAFVLYEADAPKWAKLQHVQQWVQWQRAHPAPTMLGKPTTPWTHDIEQRFAQAQQDVITHVVLKTHHNHFLHDWQLSSTPSMRHHLFERYHAMLHDANPEKPRLRSWLKHVWADYLPPHVLHQRMALLQTLLPQLTTQALQAHIASWTNAQLRHLTLSEAVLLLLPTQHLQQQPWPKALENIDFKHPKTLAGTLAPQYFSHVMLNTIPTLCRHIAQQRQIKQANAAIQACVMDAQRATLKHYVAFWLAIPPRIKQDVPHTLISQVQALHQAAHGQLAMQQQWHAVQKALHATQPFKSLMHAADQQMIQHVFETDQLMHDLKWMTTLDQVHHQLQQIQKDRSGVQAFKLSIKILNKKTHNQPILTWFDLMDEMAPNERARWMPMAESIVQTLFNTAGKHIDAVWQITGRKFFDNHLANHYPFATHALRDASLHAFSQYYGPQHGILTLFAKHYLVPFVAPHHSRLKFRQFHGHSIPIRQEALTFFTQSRALQAMFFPNGALHVPFSLTPLQVPSSNFQTTLDLADKNIVLDAQTQAMMMLQWPMTRSRMVGITISKTAGQSRMISRHGPWALFRLLDTAKIETHPGGHTPHLLFNVHGLPVVLAIETTSEATNPFRPKLFKAYHMPDHLT